MSATISSAKIVSNELPIPENWNSIYIPRIDFAYTKTQLTEIFDSKYKVGHISRIDFVAVDPSKGSGRMAYIHFEYWYDTKYSKWLRNSLETTGLVQFDFQYSEHGGQMTLFRLRMLINKTPVPATTLNMDQLSECFSKLNTQFQDYKTESENTIRRQQDHINYLFEMVNFMITTQHNNNTQSSPTSTMQIDEPKILLYSDL